MNAVKKMFLFFVTLLLQNTLFSQTISSNQVSVPDTLNKVADINKAETPEPVPTPENQGFDKVMVNGKPVYFKKVDGVVIEYKPE